MQLKLEVLQVERVNGKARKVILRYNHFETTFVRGKDKKGRNRVVLIASSGYGIPDFVFSQMKKQAYAILFED